MWGCCCPEMCGMFEFCSRDNAILCSFTFLHEVHVPRGRTVRCAHAVRKVGCFSPPAATGPSVLNSVPYSPCQYTRDFLFESDACHGSQGPEFCTPHAVLNGSRTLL